MNLIEQLGGYKAAKEKYESRPFDLAWSDIGEALLDHRRQHGIFEIGNRVVYSAKFCDESENNGFGEITYSTKDLSVFEIDNYYLVSADEIHHATPEEIAAGHSID